MNETTSLVKNCHQYIKSLRLEFVLILDWILKKQSCLIIFLYSDTVICHFICKIKINGVKNSCNPVLNGLEPIFCGNFLIES